MSKSLWEIIQENNLMKPAAYPIVEEEDCQNPRVSKFGGDYPSLPEETFNVCPSCQTKDFLLVAQLYIPTLPDFIQQIFPEKYRQSLIVFGVCPRCLGYNGYRVRIYSDEQLDQLKYQPDIGPSFSTSLNYSSRVFPPIPQSPHPFDILDAQRCYIQPKTITDWKIVESAPNSTIQSIISLFKREGVNIDHLFLDLADINIQTGALGHSLLGGWPHFAKKEDSPENYQLILNFTESPESTLAIGEGGAGQLWVKVENENIEFKYTCSCNY